MNTGIFGEGFPYSNFHDLNMDWIIKIAKDFLDQYTHIQEIIEQGKTDITNLTDESLTSLTNKKDELEELLQAWYDTHSADIANQLALALQDLNTWYNTHSDDISNQLASALADLNEWFNSHSQDISDQLAIAIADFNIAAEAKSQTLLDSWPDDYSELVEGYNGINDELDMMVDPMINYLDTVTTTDTTYYPHGDTTPVSGPSGLSTYGRIPIKQGVVYYYKRIGAYFSTIDYNGTKFALSDDTGGDQDGIFTATADGYIYITASNSLMQKAMFTDSFELYTHKNPQSIYKTGSIVREEYQKTTSKFDLMVDSKVNFLETVESINGQYYAHEAKQIGKLTGMTRYEAIPIKKDVRYYYKNIQAYFSNLIYYDGTIAGISSDTSTEQSGSIVATKDGYACISVANASNARLFTDSQTLYNAQSVGSFFVNKTLRQNKSIKEVHVYIVDPNGTGDFTTIKAAIEKATQYMDSVIYVNDGTYDLVSEFGSSYLDSTTTDIGLVLKNRVHLICSSKSKIVLNYTGNNEHIKENFSIFNAGEYGFTLEGANLYGANIRYCVHDERAHLTDMYSNNYISCYMYLDNSQSWSGAGPSCLGIGLGINGNILIDGCHFKSEDVAISARNSLYIHNSASANAQSKVIIKNNYFEGSDNTMVITWYGESTLITPIYITNNSVGDNIIVRAEHSATIENIITYQWNNEIRSA